MKPLAKPNVMLDFETLDVCPTSRILSIGAVKFDETKILDEFYITLSIKDKSEPWIDRLSISKDTMQWWMKQSPEILQSALTGGVPYRDGFKQFLDWYGNYSLPIWSNSAAFDIAIAEHHCHQMKEVVPWKYWDQRCYRTIFKLLGDTCHLPERKDAHNALEDAKYQAQCLVEMIR